MADSVVSVRASTDPLRAVLLIEPILATTPAATTSRLPAEASASTLEALGDALTAIVGPMDVRRGRAPVLELHLADAAAARLPWELARATRPDDRWRGIVRRAPAIGRPFAGPGPIETVAMAVVAEHKRRGLVAETLAGLYRDHDRWSVSAIELEGASAPAPAAVFHLVGDSGSVGDPMRLLRAVRCLRTRLFILDLALGEDPRNAWPALGDAHELCWRLMELEPSLSVVSGTFAASTTRVPQLAALIRGLSDGAPLDDLACELQRLESRLPLDPSRRPDASVSLWTAPRQLVGSDEPIA